MYKYYNANPRDLHIEDCTARALSTALGIPWSDAYDMLSKSARDMGMMMSSVDAVEEFLDRWFERVYITEETVSEFIRNHPRGRFLITMPNHITALVEGVNYDTFNPGNKRIWSAWTIK